MILIQKKKQLDPRVKFISDIYIAIYHRIIFEFNKRKVANIKLEEQFGFLF